LTSQRYGEKNALSKKITLFISACYDKPPILRQTAGTPSKFVAISPFLFKKIVCERITKNRQERNSKISSLPAIYVCPIKATVLKSNSQEQRHR
jgi:hypothetical protein